LPDITGCVVKSHGKITYTGAESTHSTRGQLIQEATERTEDDDYADVLVRMWSLATGRIPRLGIRPSQLTEQELLWFWDDLAPAAGRHAKVRPIRSGAAR
jgi:hypothetical protein